MNKGEQIYSGEIKAALLAMFRYGRQTGIVVPECVGADIFVINGKNHGIEIEIKTSMADLRHDKIKPKWEYMWTGVNKYGEVNFRPNYFYYCVPESLEIPAWEYIQTLDERIGLYVYRYRHSRTATGLAQTDCIKSIRKAGMIHNKEIDDNRKLKIMRRLSAEIAIQYFNNYLRGTQ